MERSKDSLLFDVGTQKLAACRECGEHRDIDVCSWLGSDCGSVHKPREGGCGFRGGGGADPREAPGGPPGESRALPRGVLDLLGKRQGSTRERVMESAAGTGICRGGAGDPPRQWLGFSTQGVRASGWEGQTFADGGHGGARSSRSWGPDPGTDCSRGTRHHEARRVTPQTVFVTSWINGIHSLHWCIKHLAPQRRVCGLEQTQLVPSVQSSTNFRIHSVGRKP